MPLLAAAWMTLCAALRSIKIGVAALICGACALAGAMGAEAFEHAFRLRLPFVTLEGLGPRLADLRAADAAALKTAQARIAAVAAAQSRATATVVAAYAPAAAQIGARFKILKQEVPAYVTPKDDAGCTVNAGAVRLLDAATGPLPGVSLTPGGADDAPSGVALSTLVGTDVGNDAAALENADQLSALQAWVRAQQAAWAARVGAGASTAD